MKITSSTLSLLFICLTHQSLYAQTQFSEKRPISYVAEFTPGRLIPIDLDGDGDEDLLSHTYLPSEDDPRTYIGKLYWLERKSHGFEKDGQRWNSEVMKPVVVTTEIACTTPFIKVS